MGRKNRVRKQRREQAKAQMKELQELKQQLLEQSIHIIFTNSPLFLERLQQKIVYWSRRKDSAFYELGAAGELDRLQKLKKFVQDSLAILDQGFVVSLEEERDGKTVTHNLMFEWLLIVQAIVQDLDDDSLGRNSVMDCPKVKIAGESLNALGGKDFMYSVYELFPRHLSRPIDVAWHGIGDWKC